MQSSRTSPSSFACTDSCDDLNQSEAETLTFHWEWNHQHGYPHANSHQLLRQEHTKRSKQPREEPPLLFCNAFALLQTPCNRESLSLEIRLTCARLPSVREAHEYSSWRHKKTLDKEKRLTRECLNSFFTASSDPLLRAGNQELADF